MSEKHGLPWDGLAFSSSGNGNAQWICRLARTLFLGYRHATKEGRRGQSWTSSGHSDIH
ncbi:MAG: hypothetical protein NZ709_01100 [Candidatus Marinimicrobia bacterium]|nr:hypothetical protein [Candidatus Neomarinimicrobiota bacterium]